MNSTSFKTDLKQELRIRFLSQIKNDLKLHLKTQNCMFQLETPVLGWQDEWSVLQTKELLTYPKTNRRLPRVNIVAGNIGAGKTTLARSILNSWLMNDKEFSAVEEYEGIFVIDGEVLDKDETLSVIKSTIPTTISKWGFDVVCEWIEETKILLIIDDFLLDTDEEKYLLVLLEEWKKLDVLILTSKEDGPNVVKMLHEFRPCFYSRFRKLDAQMQLEILNYFIKEKIKYNNKTMIKKQFFRKELDPVLGEFGGTLLYCQFAADYPQISINQTISSFIWDITYNNINKIKKEKSLTTDKIRDWLIEFGKRCYECLTGNAPLLGEEVLPLIETTQMIFPDIDNKSFLLDALLSQHHDLYSDNIVYTICHQKQQEVMAAFYVLKKNMDGMPLKRMFKRIKYDRDDEIAIYMAGLLSLFLNEQFKSLEIFDDDIEKKQKKIERVMKNLALHTERSSDPIVFTMRILHEMQYKKDLISLFLHDAVIPHHLHIHDMGILGNAIKEICEYSFPSKISLLIRQDYRPPELLKSLDIIKDYNVDLTLAEMNHLKWESNFQSDDLVQTLCEGNSVRLKDFIGCLDKDQICKLPSNEVTKHLVCLRLRICDSQTAEILNNVQKELKSLMWLEIDFDFDLDQVFTLNLSSINTPLIDLCFKNVTDNDIEKLCNFLHSISKQFSGLHIHRSSVSPQGVTELLKYFFRRDMTLNADSKTIMKYRRYRFPEMKATDPKQELTDDDVERLLGYDDRHHYCDNEVRSCYVATLQNINALKLFISMMNLVYFVYSCSNFCVTKEICGNCVVKECIA